MPRLTQKRLLSSLAYTLLVAVVATMGYFTLTVLKSPPPEEAIPPDPAALIEIEGFDARPANTALQRSLRVSLRLRTTTATPIDAQLFFLVKGDRSSGTVVAAWPTLGPTGPFTTTGHVRGAPVSTGAPVHLTQHWQRITGEVPLPKDTERAHTVIVYLFGPRGEILLSRPFSVPVK